MGSNFHHGRGLERENLESWSKDKTASKRAITSQSMAMLQSPAIESKHNRLNICALQFPRTGCMQSPLLCSLWDDVSQCIHTIVAYSLQPQNSICVNFVVVRLIMNVWFHYLQHWWEGYFGDTARMNTCYGSYMDNIALSITNIAAAS